LTKRGKNLWAGCGSAKKGFRMMILAASRYGEPVTAWQIFIGTVGVVVIGFAIVALLFWICNKLDKFLGDKK